MDIKIITVGTGITVWDHDSSTTPSITTFSITTLSMKGLYVTLGIKETKHKITAIMLSVEFYLL